MLLGYNRQVLSAALIGTGAEWVGEGTPDKLMDSSPQSVARLGWLTGSAEITDFVEIQFPFPVNDVPRVAMLIAPAISTETALPIGLKLELVGRLASGGGYTYDLGGNSMTQRTRRLPGGATGAVWVLDADLSLCSGVALRIYNDVGGATVFTSTTDLDLGEFIVQPAVTLCGKPGYQWGPSVDPTLVARTLTSQRTRVERVPYRNLSLDLAPASASDAQNEGLDNSLDWLRLDDYLATAQDVIVVLRYQDDNGNFDEDVLHANAIFGYAESTGGMRHVAGSRPRRYEKQIKITEIPG